MSTHSRKYASVTGSKKEEERRDPNCLFLEILLVEENASLPSLKTICFLISSLKVISRIS